MSACAVPAITHPRHDDSSHIGIYAETEWRYLFVEPVIDDAVLPNGYHGMRSSGRIIIDEALASHLLAEFEKHRPRNDAEIIQSIEHAAISAAEREALIKARLGQGRFRESVRKIELCCRITKVTTLELLRASHIKPWRCCADNAERLDGNNGLLLTRNADHLFDSGLITFGDNGEIIFSRAVADEDLKQMGIIAGNNVGPFASQQCQHLAYHRQNVFKGN